MADPVEDKGSLAERLEEDRQKMAVQVSELKKDYNVPRRLRASVQKYPWQWIMGGVLTGFLLSRVPARRKKVYLWPDYLSRSEQVVPPPQPERNAPGNARKVWSFAQPVISAYLARELYQNVRRPDKHAKEGRPGI